ncbi:MAG: hypothetical protein IJ572_05340 [Bacilli bacterium]|nr:hypothetical protein [Bacilli bacterium]
MGKFISVQSLINSLEEHLNMSYDRIKSYVASSGVILCEKDIKSYLEREFNEKDPLLKEKIEANKNKKTIEAKAQRFVDSLKASKYSYNSYTLTYYKKSVSIFKVRCLKLLFIIDNIYNNNINSIKETLESLDIVIDENNNILFEDVARIYGAFVENFKALANSLKKANNLETYLNESIVLDDIYTEEEKRKKDDEEHLKGILDFFDEFENQNNTRKRKKV